MKSNNRRHHWAMRTLQLCQERIIDVNHPDATAAANIVGFDKALAIVTAPRQYQDAMTRRVSGSYGHGKRR